MNECILYKGGGSRMVYEEVCLTPIRYHKTIHEGSTLFISEDVDGMIYCELRRQLL